MSRFRRLNPFWHGAIPFFVAMIAFGGMVVNDLSAYERKALFENFTNDS